MAACGWDAGDRPCIPPFLVEGDRKPCQSFRHGLCFGLLAFYELSTQDMWVTSLNSDLAYLRLPFRGRGICAMATMCQDTAVSKKTWPIIIVFSLMERTYVEQIYTGINT